MIRALFVLLLAGMAVAQQTQSLGDIARANRAKNGKASTADLDKSKEEKQNLAKPKKVFTNDDIASPPTSSSASNPESAPEPERRVRPGLSLRQITEFHNQIGFHRGMLIALEREAKPLRDRKNLTDDEQTKLYNLELRIGWQKKAITDIEDKLYQ